MRDQRIDILRFVGLSMIILAHVNPPGFLFQLRNFDVPLMVLVSGASFSISYSCEAYKAYLWKRVRRLVFPVWIFLTLYFTARLLFSFPLSLPSADVVVESYMLLSGIGYVWIIRVFLLVALVAPCLENFSRSTQSNIRFFAPLVLIYSLYELVFMLVGRDFSGFFGYFLVNVVYFIVPFSIVFAIGLRISIFSDRDALRWAVLFLLCFWGVGAFYYFSEGRLVSTQNFKYPPLFYYFSYALGVSLFFWAAAGKVGEKVSHHFLGRVLLFCARNSIWVYLWHIFYVDVVQLPFYAKYFLVYGLSVATVYIQIEILKRVIIPRVASSKVKRELCILLTG